MPTTSTTMTATAWLEAARPGYCARTGAGASDCDVDAMGSWTLPKAIQLHDAINWCLLVC